MDIDRIQKATRMLLEAVGENPDRKGLRETPRRVARMYEEILGGMAQDPAKMLGKIFHEEYDELVLVRGVPVFSLCEHHLLPFVGEAHVAYLADGKRVVGISKIARLVDIYARRLQLQERFTGQIADTLMEALHPRGVMVIVEAQHLCMSMRGVKKQGARIVTSAMRGIFLRDIRTRTEALNLIMSTPK